MPFILAPFAVIVAVIVAMDPIAMTVAIAIATVLAMTSTGSTPDAGYLDRAAPVKLARGRVVTHPGLTPVRFLPPVWDASAPAHDIARVVTPDDVRAEIDRLVACLHRAHASRHKARASAYAARIDVLSASV